MATEIRYLTKEKAIQAVAKNGNELKYCSKKLKNSEDVVIAAIKQYSWTFNYASDELKSNKTFILKALHEGVPSDGLIDCSNINIQSDIEVITLALEKSHDGWIFKHAQGEVALNKKLAAEALVKWGAYAGSDDFDLWESIHPSLQKFFPENCWYEKAQAYLNNIEQPKNVLGGCTDEDGVVW